MLNPRRLPVVLLGCLAALPLLVTAAYADPSTVDSSTVGGVSAAAGIEVPLLNPSDFSHPLDINNRFLPLSPGMRYILEGNVDGVPHRVVLVVTDLVKVINGVRTAVLWDRDFEDGELAEAELAFQAQDNAGAVWNLGEYPELYENGEFAGAPDTWVAGVDLAFAGFHMLAQPRVGTPSYLQGLAPTIKFLDIGKVSQTGQHACDGIRCYDDVLVVDESSPLDPTSGHQLKFYAPGVGNIRVGAAGRDKEDETLVLDEVRHLSRGAMIRVRKEALALARRAFRIRADVYGRTPPSQRDAEVTR
jgi:hypothetical protein